MDQSSEYFGYRGDRVRAHTASAVNRTIDQETTRNIRAYAVAGPEAIEERIRTLESEWDVERALETMASSFALTGLLLGARVNKRFLAIPFVVLPFLLLHALQGWCPPLPFLRRR